MHSYSAEIMIETEFEDLTILVGIRYLDKIGP